MDKETLSNYGWIVILVLILSVLLALASPFGTFVSDAVWSATNGLFDVNDKSLQNVGIYVDGLPADTDTIIYRPENLDPDITYSEITITKSNLGKIGYTDDTENLVIPAAIYLDKQYYDSYTFQTYKVGWHIVTAIYSATNEDSTKAVFYGKENIKSVYFPDTFKQIGDLAFQNCTNLESIRLSNNTTRIGNRAFMGCVNLKTDIVIPNTTSSISSYAFYGCTNITSLTFEDGGTSNLGFGMYAFCRTSITSLSLPNRATISSSARGVFASCGNLEFVQLSEGMTVVPWQTFYNCKKLSTIIVPNSIAGFNSSCFSSCTNLSTIVYNGTVDECINIALVSGWNGSTGDFVIHCNDGHVSKNCRTVLTDYTCEFDNCPSKS